MTAEVPDSTAVRTALWRALHVQADPAPHVLEDLIGLQLVDPADGWRDRPDMNPAFTRPFRASILARARFIEDLVMESLGQGVSQYVILGAGLDSFAQRRPDTAGALQIFEIDQPTTQAWKRQRLEDLGLAMPPWLHFVPVDFEAGQTWWGRLRADGFDEGRPALVASSGVSMYLTRDAIAATLRQVASLVPGSSLVMTFMLPPELTDEALRPALETAIQGARASGTPFVSFFAPDQMLALARDAGFRTVRHVASGALGDRYFADRRDGLRPPNAGEDLLVAST